MEKEFKPDQWWCSVPNSGQIEITSTKTGKVICSLDVSDYSNEEEAVKMAVVIAALPEILTPKMVVVGQVFLTNH